MKNGARGKEYSNEDLSRTLNKFTSSVHEEPKSPIQLYYKSLEPYLRKKKHISGYEADPISPKEESSSQSQHSEIIMDTVFIESEQKTRLKTGEGWFKGETKSFSKISEEEVSTDKNSYGINLVPRKVRKLKRSPKNKDIKSIVSSFF